MQQARKGLILGGNGALGKAMVDSFLHGGWQVVSLDVVNNPAAQTNVIVDPNQAMKLQVDNLRRQT